ncbi:chromosome condensation complex Condensin, subunit G [Malassezia psittaci]|uniref:Chromosome condensation complex Condensin, subunit G n=1 Tax=Malassezia psittaci TaxID=1821823 RepID=A0AAF0FB43_9BASI|nr:chromosome condensation complex Condensin, subunit G [Malassezia psittaci]
MPAAIDGKALVDSVQGQIPVRFQEAQNSVANHRKNAVTLFRLHAQCAQLTEHTQRGTRLIGEKAFNECFFRCVNRVLDVKKGVAAADRVCKFVATYAAYAIEQFGILAQRNQKRADDTPGTRFVAILLKHLLKGLRAKDKNVRLRCCSCIALLVNVVESIDDELYNTLSTLLLERITDRESSVRVQAAVALARLQGSEEDETNTTRLLLHLLRHDPSADVRRAALFNLAPSPATLSYILERLQDVDPTNRRCVYLGPLKQLTDGETGSIGLGEHAIAEVVRIGLHEREASVKKSARKLVQHWLETAADGEILFLLGMLHVARTDTGEAVVLALLEDDPSLVDRVAAQLRDHSEYWKSVTPESALLARCFVLFCQTHHRDTLLDVCLPLVSELAYRIQAEYHALNLLLQQHANEELADDDDDDLPAIQDDSSLARVFVVNEMLSLAIHCDYGDEMGRRKMFMLVRDMLANAWLPAALIPKCLDVLLRLSSGQRDFVQMIVELVQELDTDLLEEDGDSDAQHVLSWHARIESDPELAAHRAALDARRLLIVRTMLERVVCALQDHSSFHGLIPQLIVPAVRSKDAVVREEGLISLGLCSLLDEKMALDTFPLLLDQIQRASGTIQQRCVQCLFDLVVVHGFSTLCRRSAEVAAQSEFDGDLDQGMQFAQQQMLTFLLSLLEHDEQDVQTAACEGIAKLLLMGMLQDDDVLKSLILIYFSPDTSANQPLRQCLSYFLPLFCSSHARHQRMVQRVFMEVFTILTNVYLEKDRSQPMTPPSQIATQLLDWCNPEKLVLSVPDKNVHVDVAQEVLQRLCTIEKGEERKALASLLSKFALPASLDERSAKGLAILAHTVRERAEESTLRTACTRFEVLLEKKYASLFPTWAPSLASADGTLQNDAFADLKSMLEALPPVQPNRRRTPAARSRKDM